MPDMLKKLVLLTALLIFSVFLTSCQFFGDPLLPIKGIVKNFQGNPIEGVSIQLMENRNGEFRRTASEQITKSDGAFNFTIIGSMPERLWIDCQKEGFKSERKELNVEEKKESRVEIVLEAN